MVKTEDGFTLIEIIIAILLLTVGIFGMAKATAGMIRMLGNGDRAGTAAIYAQERLELLRATACAGATTGSMVRDQAYDLFWDVTTDGNVAGIRVMVQYNADGGYRTDTVTTQELCTP